MVTAPRSQRPQRPHRRALPRRADPISTLALLIGIVAASLPLARVIAPDMWMWGVLGIATAILAAGYLARRARLRAPAVAAIELAVGVGILTLVFLRDTAFLWIIPLAGSFEQAASYTTTAIAAIERSAAPMEATTALSFFVVAGVALFTIAVDHVALTTRMPLLAAIALVTVSLIPTVVVPTGVNLGWFVLLASAIVALLWADTRSRRTQPGSRTRGGMWVAGAPAVAATIGAGAIVVTLIVAPALPHTLARGLPGTGSARIDPSLSLGEDLRQPDPIEVLRVRSDAPLPPYLRVATLSGFDGATWEPDKTNRVPLENPRAFGSVGTDAGIEVGRYTATIDIVGLDSPWLPVPFPAVEVSGLQGEWSAMPINRTVSSTSSGTVGQSYVVTTAAPEPTLDEIRDATATPARGQEETIALPDDLPAVIAQTAREVTAGTQNDYDALEALQDWFRGPDFRYSLDAPVRDGFDGTGVDAVASFLDVRAGYCVHFASAFALMARTLGMPTRIVVGYLPGSATGEKIEGQDVRSVSSTQLHAWPEVRFEGIGWVAFEPTKSLGTPTDIGGQRQPEETDPDASPSPTPRPTSSASPRPTSTSSARPDLPDEATPLTPGQRSTATLGWSAVGAGLVALLLTPATIGFVRRQRLRAAARSGDAAAAWTLLASDTRDLGIRVSESDTPRMFADRLRDEHGVAEDDLAVLVSAIEHASYAPGSTADSAHTAGRAHANRAVGEALDRACGHLRATASGSERFWAAALPRSLVVRVSRRVTSRLTR